MWSCGRPVGGAPVQPHDVARILLYKRSALSSTYSFGISGLTPDPATAAATESFVTTNNASSALGGGATWAGKRVAVGNGDQFTSCTLPF